MRFVVHNAEGVLTLLAFGNELSPVGDAHCSGTKKSYLGDWVGNAGSVFV